MPQIVIPIYIAIARKIDFLTLANVGLALEEDNFERDIPLYCPEITFIIL